MIRRNGRTEWNNIHLTVKLALDDLIDIDNSNPQGFSMTQYEVLNQTAVDINNLVKEAATAKKKIRAIGSAWALSNIQSTENWLLNTKLLNKCFEIDDDCFHPDFPEEKRKLTVIAQCGISIAELNVYLELPKIPGQPARALKTAGIGAGQTIVGAVSGNTHGSAVNFGALPDFIAAIQICNGTDSPIWIERSDYCVMNQQFADRIQSKLIRDTDTFNAALVSFGSFGVITAFAIETDPIFQITFPKVREITNAELGSLFNDPSYYSKLQHLEFVFNPYEDDGFYLIEGTRVPYEAGHPVPQPLWILANKIGYAPGDRTTKFLLNFPLVSGRKKTKILFKEYLKNAVLSEVRGTPGQLYTATITYLEGYNETAFGVSITDTLATIQLLKEATDEVRLPLVFQARIVHPGKATLGFTNHAPRAVIFEFGIVNSPKHTRFEQLLIDKLRARNIKYTLHWSKNCFVDGKRLEEMYGTDKISSWKKCRHNLFDNNPDLVNVFNNAHLQRAGLDTG